MSSLQVHFKDGMRVTLVVVAIAMAVVRVAEAQIGAWIDPGHGANSNPYGAPGFNGSAPPDEKDLNLAIALKLQTRLAGLGYISALTRYIDIKVSRSARARMAAGLEENHAGEQDVGVTFVSIHHDGDENPATIGTFIIYPGPTKEYRRSKLSYRVDSTFASYVNGGLQHEHARVEIWPMGSTW